MSELRHVAGFPVLCWRFGPPRRVISSAAYGGGIGELRWVLNATVPGDYHRDDPAVHVAELAAATGCHGPGTGLLTAVDVRDAVTVTEGPVTVSVTTGLGHPCYAAAPGTDAAEVLGTINVVGFLRVPVPDAALVNAVATVAEAKAQALADLGVPGTGTCTDATVLCCPVPDGAPRYRYGGPRSFVGAPLARAVYGAVSRGSGIIVGQ